MKTLIAGLLIFCLVSCKSSSHDAGDIPSFNFLLPDSVTQVNTSTIQKGRPTVLLYFSPDCEHCQAETSFIIRHMDSLRHVQFYFLTNDSIERIKVFKAVYKLDKYDNITVGWDNQFFFPRIFKGAMPPYSVLYDKDKKQQKIFQGDEEAEKLVQYANKL